MPALSQRSIVVAVALVVVAAGLGWLLSDLRSEGRSTATPGYAMGTCRPTPVTLRSDVGTGWAAPIRISTGGALASWPLGKGTAKPHMSPGDYWFIRHPGRRDSIQLRADRLDSPADPITFTAKGYPLGDGFIQEWSPANWYYRTSVEELENLPSAGCWRVSLVGGRSDDSIVYALRSQQSPDTR